MIYRFGTCELDTDQLLLRRNGAVVPTQPQVFDLLRYLVEHADRVVTRDEILDEIWQGRIVSDAALSSRIKSVRQAIGDSGRDQDLLRTVRGRGFRLDVPVVARGPRATDGVSGPALAVLPFRNVSGDPNQDYFADGLTDDIMTALAMWRSFPVIARGSSFAVRDREETPQETARELGARYLVEGTVRRSETAVRVTARLVDGESGHAVWAGRYDSSMAGVLGAQDAIVRKIAAAVEPKLARAEVQRSRGRGPDDLAAWDCHLRGLAFVHEMTPSSNVRAREMFERAIAIAPDYAEAHAGLAWSHNRDALLHGPDDRRRAAAEAMAAARTAVRLDPDLAVAHRELGTAFQLLERYDDALAEVKIAVDLNPSDAFALHSFGNMRDLRGDPEGIGLMETAQTLNPIDALTHAHLTYLARAYLNAGQAGEAADRANRAIRIAPDFAPAHYVLALSFHTLGETQDAQRELDRSEALQPGLIAARKTWAPYADASSNDRLRAALEACLTAGDARRATGG